MSNWCGACCTNYMLPRVNAMSVLRTSLSIVSLAVFSLQLALAADVVPPEVDMPGTQPGEVGNLESPGRCNNCHGGYNDDTTAAAGQGEPQDEPSTGWQGGPMANAGRDPIFWATLAIAEQDFDGAGDLCLRCHSQGGWYGDRSTPTDGSGLAASDSDGVDCDGCHLVTNNDNTEHAGVMVSPFIANCSADPQLPDKNCDSDSEGFYGSGMLSLWGGSDKLGPYSDADARHAFMQSKFHRDVDFCGTCHDVSNPVVGDLAPGNGTQHGAPSVVSSQDYHGGSPNLGGPREEKAAFNNPPYAYGVVERTFSEYKASAFPTTRVSAFQTLPAELQVSGGSLEKTYQASLAAGTGGDYADGDPRYFSCQSCHMRPVTSAGANKNGVQIRTDLARHDHSGGNYWLVDMIRYQAAHSLLRLGNNLSESQMAMLESGRARALEHLQQAASLVVEGGVLKVINLTGHKLITGYPEGRRMWLNIKWHAAGGQLIREDGAYGPLFDDSGEPVLVENPVDESYVQVESILEPDSPHVRIYEAHYAISSEWAATLLASGKPADLALGYDRVGDDVTMTLGELAGLPAGSHHETFHFALNDVVASDNRIPPYGMSYDLAKKRNTLPVPEGQYGNPGAGGTYRYWDELNLQALAPTGAVSADISLLYQGTSWEYIQFLEEANNGTDPAEGGNAFLGNEGENMLEAWVNAEVPVAIEVAGDRKMVPPVTMATTVWTAEATNTFSIGGTVTGLEGSGLVLQNSGGDDLAIVANGDFTFTTPLDDGSPYAVTVQSDPSNPDQSCDVTSGTGTVSGNDVTDVSVVCSTLSDVVFKDGFEN